MLFFAFIDGTYRPDWHEIWMTRPFLKCHQNFHFYKRNNHSPNNNGQTAMKFVFDTFTAEQRMNFFFVFWTAGEIAILIVYTQDIALTRG